VVAALGESRRDDHDDVRAADAQDESQDESQNESQENRRMNRSRCNMV